jgi:hypothetical protein
MNHPPPSTLILEDISTQDPFRPLVYSLGLMIIPLDKLEI